MTNQADSAKPRRYALPGTVLLVIGGIFFVNVNEDPETFMVLTILLTAPGLYLLISGAVARRIFAARR